MTIKSFKQDMIKKAQTQGICENFGQKEIRNLKDKYNYNPYGNSIDRKIVGKIDELDNWIMSFDNNDLREVK